MPVKTQQNKHTSSTQHTTPKNKTKYNANHSYTLFDIIWYYQTPYYYTITK